MGTRSRRWLGSWRLCLATLFGGFAPLFLFAPLPQAQTAARAESANLQALANHHPSWASSKNFMGVVPRESMMAPMTVVLSRSPIQQRAFEMFLADQQNPASPDYHRWLTPAEVGERFGRSQQEVNAVSAWLKSQGLNVNWVSPSRAFIGFTGSAGDVGSAFGTELRYYALKGVPRVSVSSDPMIPQALAPMIGAIHGLYFVDEKPFHYVNSAQSDSPAMTIGSTTHFIAPADFTTIYDVPDSTYTVGSGITIGIVGRSRTDFADYENFMSRTGSYFNYPNEIVPTAFGGVDPGPALSAPPAPGVSFGDQVEATLDVSRAGSVAPGANLLLVVATQASGGIEVAAQYLVNTTPVPAQIMSVSFGECESEAGVSAVTYWNNLFQQAAAEGISAFVASGDSGASGCDSYFATPPTSPAPNSPNYICSSSYATCVGGTEFDDTANPALYWNPTNSSNLGSALSYIPEGAWNEPLNASSSYQAASSGGGVSKIIATPAWQTGVGVPAARAGRYTPDIAFSASCHDGYFGCMAATAGNCVINANNSYQFEYFCGTSAAAPSMAGIAALLDMKLGFGQGNLNPLLYEMAANIPTAFHDVTVATSGERSCSINTPSMCNNSIPGPTGLSGGQAGFLVTAGYDEATGLGSLDAASFLNSWGSWLTAQTVSFQAPAPQTYGAGSIQLTASASSGLPVVFLVKSGPAIVIGTTLTITGAGSVTVVAAQAGNSIYAPASASRSFTVSPAPLTLACESITIDFGWPIPPIPAATLTGLIAGDRISASCSTAAVQNSPAGQYPIIPNPIDPNGRLSNYSLTYAYGTLTIGTPATSVPLVLLLSPASAVTGGTNFMLTVTGGNFTTNSVVLWNGAARGTSPFWPPNAPMGLQATIFASDIAAEGTAMISVVNPAPYPGTSAAVPFAVQSSAPVPTISGTSLADASNGNGRHELTLMGTDFIPSSAVEWNGTSLPTTYLSPWQLSATVPDSDFAALPAQVRVMNSAVVSNTVIVP